MLKVIQQRRKKTEIKDQILVSDEIIRDIAHYQTFMMNDKFAKQEKERDSDY